MTDIATEPKTTPDPEVSKPQTTATPRKLNKFEAALLEKKKSRRAAHRATIKRSNTNV